MKKEDAKKIAAIIACEMIGCNGDCDNIAVRENSNSSIYFVHLVR